MHTFTESDDYLKRRGQYSILRAVHEDKKLALRDTFTVVQSYLNDAIKAATCDDPNSETIQAVFSGIHHHLDKAADIADQLKSLAKQRHELRNILWPKS